MPISQPGITSSNFLVIDSSSEKSGCRFILVDWQAYLYILIGHPYIIRIRLQVFGCCHNRKLDRSFVSKRFVRPFSDGSNFFHGGDAVIGN